MIKVISPTDKVDVVVCRMGKGQYIELYSCHVHKSNYKQLRNAIFVRLTKNYDVVTWRLKTFQLLDQPPLCYIAVPTQHLQSNLFLQLSMFRYCHSVFSHAHVLLEY